MTLKHVDSIVEKFLKPFKLVPKAGLSPKKLALSVTIGIVSGLFPVFGATTLVSLLLTAIFRQNLLIVQSVQWLLAIFQVVLIIPFMRAGAYLLNQPDFLIGIAQIKQAFEPGLLTGIKTLGVYHTYAILSWTIISIPFGIVLYVSFLVIFRKKNQNNHTLSDNEIL